MGPPERASWGHTADKLFWFLNAFQKSFFKECTGPKSGLFERTDQKVFILLKGSSHSHLVTKGAP